MNIIELSKYILHRFSQQSPDGVTPMKLQKLLYYVKAWTLVAGHNVVTSDFKRWDYGPVNREVYDTYKRYGRTVIDVPSPSEIVEPHEKDLVNFIIENYIKFDAFKLSAMTHAEDPWKSTEKNAVISEESMRAYYQSQHFAKNLNPFDLSGREFYPLENHAFTIDMTEKDAVEIVTYPSYRDYKKALDKAEEEWEKALI